jgi:hypothetical protein
MVGFAFARGFFVDSIPYINIAGELNDKIMSRKM